MHELGVVFYIIRDVKEVAAQNNVAHVNSVTIELGEVSGVIPDYLTDCWDWAVKKEPILENAKLITEITEAVTICDDCKKEYPTVKYAKICPYCKSENTYLVRGSDVSIKQIEVDENGYRAPEDTGAADAVNDASPLDVSDEMN